MPTEREMRSRLGAATVAVCGCGGLGSNVAEMLVRAGVGSLVLADFDRVEADNLNRQFFFADQVGELKAEALAVNLRRIRPDVKLTLVTKPLTSTNVAECVSGADVIVEAVDAASTKAMLLTACACDAPGVPVVAASGLAGLGSTGTISTVRVTDRLYVAGDLESDVDRGLPLVSSRVVAVAAAQAHMVIRLLLGYEEP